MEVEVLGYSSSLYARSPTSASSTCAANKLLGDSGFVDEEADYCYDTDDDAEEESEGGCHHYLSMSTYPSLVWIALQVSWRLLLSFLPALLVFYLLTKPLPPRLSIQSTKVEEFEVAQGVDSSGVATSYLSFNISILFVIDNRSKVYGLGTTAPLLQIYFGPLSLATSLGAKVYVGSQERKSCKAYGGATKKAMYGGGRDMQDMLPFGFPVVVTLTFISSFRLFHPTFHHHARCYFFIHQIYDNTLPHFHPYNVTCLVTP